MPEQMTKQDAIETLKIFRNDYTREGSAICRAIDIAIGALRQHTIEPEESTIESEVRLIDANALHAKIYEDSERNYGAEANIAQVLLRIETAPTIEAKPVRYGRWILCKDQYNVDNDNGNYAYYCSCCKHQDVHAESAKVSFCWNCGAYMREEGANNG